MGDESETAAIEDGRKSSPTQTMQGVPASATETLAATPQELSALFQTPQAPASPRATPPRTTGTLRRASPTPGLGAPAPVHHPLDTQVETRPSVIETLAPAKRPSVVETVAPAKRPSVTATLAAATPVLPTPPGTAETRDGLAFAAARAADPEATRDVSPASRLEPEETSTTDTIFRGSSSAQANTADALRTPAALRGSGRPESPDGVDRNLALARLQQRMLGVEPESVKIGRFIVLRKLGQGAMGIVYLAYDPKLDRKVALKLVDTSSLGSEMGDAQVRLEREARAAAALGHPNVVTVYDVGHQDADVFLAMEFVEGETLTDWMKRDHGWKEVTALFAEIARGLAAAHDADLVHRDFKPDNVLMGDDGRPRIADFGLARPTEGWSARDAAKMLDEGSTPSSRALALRSSDAMASTGEVCGTPAYMAPEQFVGVGVTGASDQFGFCASLYEALFGHRPYKGDSVTELAVAVIENDRQPLPPKHGVPKAVVQTVLQGLTPEVGKRHASMHEVADRLEAALRAQTRNRVLAGGALLAVLGVGFGAQAAVALDEQPCEAASTDIDATWDAQTRASVRTALGSAGLATEVADQLDAYATSWTTQRVEACESTRVTGEQSDLGLQLRTACLDRARARLGVTAAALKDAPTSDLVSHIDAALPDLSSCEDLGFLQAQLGSFTATSNADVDTLAAWTEASSLMAELSLVHDRPPAQWQRTAAKLVELADTHEQLAEAQAYGRYWLGRAYGRSGDNESALAQFQGALPAAARALDRRLVPAILLKSAEIETQTRDFPAADANLALASALVAAVSSADERRTLRRSIDIARANAARLDDRPQEVADLVRPWLEADDTPPREREALLSALASGCRQMGDMACAIENHGEALKLAESLPEIEPIELAGRYANVGLMHADVGDGAQAVEHLQHAAEIVENAFDGHHPMLGSLLSDIGGIEGALLDPKDGERDLLAGLAIHEHNHGKDSPELVEALIDLNKTQLRLGKLDEAQKHGQWALRIVDATFEGQHPRRADPRMPLADAYAATGRFDDAAVVLREGLEILDSPKTHPMQRAEFQFALARALAPNDPDAAREISAAAVAGIADFEPGEPLRDAIEGWRAEALDQASVGEAAAEDPAPDPAAPTAQP